ncbi:MAG: TRAP transporter small permease [Candidatus Sumerlaeota bacterium]
MWSRLAQIYHSGLRNFVIGLMAASGLAVLGMMAVTCIDVVGRMFGHPLKGSIDIVSLLGGVAIACALPYTTAVKGHVAIEYFFHKLHRIGRIVVDTMVRLVAILLFGLLAWRNVHYGLSFMESRQVTPTLQLPLFWLPWLISICCLAVVLVIFYNLTHPGRTMIKP